MQLQEHAFKAYSKYISDTFMVMYILRTKHTNNVMHLNSLVYRQRKKEIVQLGTKR